MIVLPNPTRLQTLLYLVLRRVPGCHHLSLRLMRRTLTGEQRRALLIALGPVRL